MSIRQYRPRRERRNGISRGQGIGLALLFSLYIALQIAYPLVGGNTLRVITISTIYLGAALTIFHANLAFGKKFSYRYIAITLIFAEGVEILGVHSGWPFGTYSYDRSLGFAIAGVPILVPFAWLVMAYPVLIASRIVAKGWSFLYGALGLVAADYFLDPQMVAANRWHWKLVGPHTPFAPSIPLSNSAGWLFAGMGLMAILSLALPRERRKGGASTLLPNLLLLWTGFSGIVGNIFFFHRIGVGLLGAVLEIALYAPYIYISQYSRPDSR